MLDPKELSQAMKPYIISWFTGGSAGGAGAAVLSPAQYPEALLRDGSRALLGNLAVADGVKIDGVDISVFAANQVLAGVGMYGGGALGAGNVTLNIGAGAGISVSANDVAVNQAFPFVWTGAHTFNNTATFNNAITGSVGFIPGQANWATYGTGFGGAAIYNDGATYQALMIVGNNSMGGNRVVKLFDDVFIASNLGSFAYTQKTNGWRIDVGGNSDFRSLFVSSTATTEAISTTGAVAGGRSVVSIGDIAVNYTPTIPKWNAGSDTSFATLLLNAADYSSIGFHDSGLRIDFIRVGAGIITMGYDGGSGAAQVHFPNHIQHPDYISQLARWRISNLGEGDFRYLFVDEMHAKSFVADLEQALAGGQIISKSVAVLAQAFTAPSPGGVAALWVRDLPSAPNMAAFQAGDVVRLRQFSRSSGALSIADCWGVVTQYFDGLNADEGQQYWTFTRSTSPNAGAMSAGTVVQPDAIILDYGTSGNGFYEVNAIDGIYGANSPYAQIVTWSGHPATGSTLRSRYGNLRGVWGIDNEFGLFVGDGIGTTNKWLRISNLAAELHNLPIKLFNSGIQTVNVDSAGQDVWIGVSSSDKRFYWNGSSLVIGEVASSKANTLISGGEIQFRTNLTSYIKVATDGRLVITQGNTTSNSINWENASNQPVVQMYGQDAFPNGQLVVAITARQSSAKAKLNLALTDNDLTALSYSFDTNALSAPKHITAAGYITAGNIGGASPTFGDVFLAGRLQTTGYGSSAWELGNYTPVTVTPTGHVAVRINGVEYQIPARAV